MSTVFTTDRTPSTSRSARTTSALEPVSHAICSSEKPICFAASIVGAPSPARPSSRMRPPAATVSRILPRNHASMPLRACTRATSQPRRNASATWNMRCGVGVETRSSRSFSPSAERSSTPSMPRPARPCSSERSAFCSASSNVRPMAMTSPTLFMRVVSVSLVPLNFSNAKRGTFTTQ